MAHMFTCQHAHEPVHPINAIEFTKISNIMNIFFWYAKTSDIYYNFEQKR